MRLILNLTLIFLVALSCQTTQTNPVKAITIPIEMVFVEGGEFPFTSMNDIGVKQTRKVQINDFYIGKYEVTQGQWILIMGDRHFNNKGKNNPVEFISWYDAIEFCNKASELEELNSCYKIIKDKKDTNNLSIRDEKKYIVECDFNANGYRLPTDAEWEFARIGGNLSKNFKFSGSNNIEEVAVYGDSFSGTKEVGTKKPNELGLFDMNGNVWEYCWDWYSTTIDTVTINPTGAKSGHGRTIRGGSYFNGEMKGEHCMYKSYVYPSRFTAHDGFRVVRIKK